MKIIILLLAVFLFTAAAPAQPPAESVQCNEEFARFLVEQQVSESTNVTDTQKRVRILLRSADFLWKYDQPTARSYFAEAFKTAGDRFKEKGYEVVKVGALNTYLSDLRFEVIRVIAKKDAKWAQDLSDELLAEYEKTAADRPKTETAREAGELIQIAVAAAEFDRNLAMNLFRRAMLYPLDHYWYHALYSLPGKDPGFAASLYSQLLANYRNAPPRRLLFLSAFPFRNERIFGPDGMSFGNSVPDNVAADPFLQASFLETFFERVRTFTADPEAVNAPGEHGRYPETIYMVGALREMEPIVLRQFPRLLQRYSEARSRAEAALTAAHRKTLDDLDARNASASRGFDEQLKELEEANGIGKLADEMILSLMIRGGLTELQFKKLESWLDKITEEKVRRNTSNYFWFRRSKLAIEERRLTDAEKFSAKLSGPEYRAIVFFDIAEKQLENVNDAATVYQTLNEVGKLARQSDDRLVTAKILLGLANRYEKINHGFAMTELADAIKIINQIPDPNIFSTAVHHQITAKNFSFFAVYSMPGYDLEATLNLLSKNDFEMSLSNAKALEDKYLRTLAVIAVAKNCVNKSPKIKKPR